MLEKRNYVLVALAVLPLLISGPASGAQQARTVVRVSAGVPTEMAFTLSKRTVPKGTVVFQVVNRGVLPHDFVVLRTNIAPGKLPVVGQRAREVGRVGKTPVLGRGETHRLTLTLRPGKYVLICNVPGHYRAGMFVGFSVR
jgi:uncharacterized cupredoxin-like copper-binding protein